MFYTLYCVHFRSEVTVVMVKLKQCTKYNELLFRSVCGENMSEVIIPIATPPGSSDNPVAFINNSDIFTPLAAGETFLAPDDVLLLAFNVTIDPAVTMTSFQIGNNGETVVKVKLEEGDTIIDLTVIFSITNECIFLCF